MGICILSPDLPTSTPYCTTDFSTELLLLPVALRPRVFLTSSCVHYPRFLACCVPPKVREIFFKCCSGYFLASVCPALVRRPRQALCWGKCWTPQAERSLPLRLKLKIQPWRLAARP